MQEAEEKTLTIGTRSLQHAITFAVDTSASSQTLLVDGLASVMECKEKKKRKGKEKRGRTRAEDGQRNQRQQRQFHNPHPTDLCEK